MRFLAFGIFCLFLTGCFPQTVTQGRDIDASKINLIQKGTTSTKDIEALFGPPDMKSPVSATEEKWIYSYLNITSTMGANHGIQKTLDLFIKDGIVLNYGYVEKDPSVQVK